jgi:gliding motility-associated-like protein
MKRTVFLFERVSIPVLLSLLITLILPNVAKAQPASAYTATAFSQAYTPIVGGTSFPQSSLGDDRTLQNIPIGFNFTFCSNTYSSLSACSNGWLSLSNSNSVAYSNSLGSLAGLAPGVLMPLWDDMNDTDNVGTGTPPSVSYVTTGSVGSRVFTIQYDNMRWDYGSSNGVVSFQVKLYENTNVIQYIYKQGAILPFVSSTNASFGATIGIANSSTDYKVRANVGALSGGTDVSSTVFTTNLSSAPTSNQVYQFTPPPNCLGFPTAGNITPAGNTSTCPGSSITYTLTGYSTNSSIQIQWQTSPTGAAPWTNVGTLNSPTFTLLVSQSVFVRAQVTCVFSGGVSYSTNTPTVTAQVPTYASIPFLESFETWVTKCSTTDAPASLNWLNLPFTGNNSWRRDDQGASASWGLGTSGAYTPAATLGSRSARFHTVATNATTAQGNLDLYVNLSTAGTKAIIFDYNNASGTDKIVVSLSTNAGTTFTALDSVGVSGSGWAKKVITTTATGAQSIVRFTAVSDFGTSDIGLDSVFVGVIPTCATPFAGTITSNTSSPICTNSPFTLTASNYSIFAGITLQWQETPFGQNTWTNIIGANSSTYTIANQSSSTQYRVIVSCTTSGLSDTSAAFDMLQNSPINCYCTPSYSTGCANDYISNVTFNVINNTSVCSPGNYSLTSSPIPILVVGSTYNLSVTTTGTVSGNNAYVWIDYDASSSFTNGFPELVLSQTPSGSNLVNTYSPNITIPATTIPGTKVMRVRSVRNGSGANNPCNTFTYGETEDYYIKVAPLPPTILANNSPVCSNNTIVLVATSPYSGIANYTWTGPAGGQLPVSGVSGDTLRVYGATALDAGTYSVRVTVNGVSSSAATANVVVTPSPVITFDSSNSPLCSGSNLCFTINTAATPTISSYQWAGPATSPWSSTAQSPCRLAVTTADSGNYILTVFGTNGCNTNDTFNVVIKDVPTVTSITTVDPLTCGSNTGKLTLNGLAPNTHYDSLYYTKNGLDTMLSAGFTTNATGSYTINNLGAGIYDSILVYNSICISALQGPNTINDPSAPPQPLISSNSPVCSGNTNSTLNLFASPIAGAHYQWSGPGTFAAGQDTLQNPTKLNVTTADSGVYSLVVTVGTCPSLPVTLLVIVRPKPTISLNSKTNPTTCIPKNGQIKINTGLSGTVSCTVTYVRNGQTTNVNPANSVGGIITLSGLDSGKYTNIRISINGSPSCQSNLIDSVRLAAPPVPNLTAPSPVGGCYGSLVTLSANSTSQPGVTFDWTTAVATTSIQNTNTANPFFSNITTLDNGVYTVKATKDGCVSNGVNVTVAGGNAPAKPNIISNAPICSGSQLTLFVSPLVPNANSYLWTGPTGPGAAQGFTPATSALPAGSVGTGSSVSILNPSIANSGTYTVVAYNNGCPSLPGVINVLINKKDTINVTGVSPTHCNGTDGKLTICGLVPSSGGYTILYDKNNIAASPITNLTADTNGCIKVSGFAQGNYSNIRVSHNGCLSNSVGPVLLTDPPIPSVTTSNNSPVCEGGNVIFNTLPSIANVTYTWSGPTAFVTPSAPTIKNPNINNATAAYTGVYTVVVTDTATSCSSLPAFDTVTVNEVPVTPVATSNSPACTGASLTLNATTTTTGTITYQWIGPGGYSSGVQSPVRNNVTVAFGGTYSVFASKGGCQSASGTTVVSVIPSPIISTGTTAPSTTCPGNGFININGVSLADTFDVIYTFNGITDTVFNLVAVGAPSHVTLSNIKGGTYTNISVLAHTTGHCQSNAISNVTILGPIPPSINASFSQTSTACVGAHDTITISTVTNPAFISNVTYAWTTLPVGGQLALSNNTNFSTANINNASTADSGIYVVKVTDNTTQCTSLPDTLLIGVYPVPVTPVVTLNNSPVCEGGTLTLGAASFTIGNTYFAWSGPSITPGTHPNDTAQSPIIFPVTLSAQGIYTVQAVVNGCYSLPTTTSVTVKPLPQTPVANNNSPICAGDTLHLIALDTIYASAVSGVTYSWSGPNGYSYTDTGKRANIPYASLANNGTYTVTSTIAGCTSLPSTTTATIYPIPPAPTATSNTPLCDGDTIKLFANSPVPGTFHWSGVGITNNTLANTQNPVIPNAPVNYSGYYFVSITSPQGCTSQTDQTLVIVYPIPATPVPTNSGPVCQNGSFTVSVPSVIGASAYSWNGPNSFNSSVQNPPAISPALLVDSGDYQIRVTVSGCTSLPGTTHVSIQPFPAVPTLITNSGPICYGSSLTLSCTAVPNVNYVWSGPNISPSPNTTALNSVTFPTVTQSGVDTVRTITVPLGCFSQGYKTTAVTVKPIPPSPVATSNSPLCTGTGTTTLTLFASTVPGASGYHWAGQHLPGIGIPQTRFTPSANVQNPTLLNVTTLDSGIYWVVDTVNGCPSIPDTIHVIINQTPTAPVVPNPNLLFCQYSVLPNLSNYINGQNLLWYLTPTGGVGTPTFTPSTLVPAFFVRYVSQVINGCESPRTLITISITPKPNPPVPTFSSYTYCQGDTATQFSVVGGQTVLWYTLPSGGTGSPIPIVPSTLVPGTQTYYVSQVVNGCESDRAAITVTVNPKPVKPTVTSPVVYCTGDTSIAPLSAVANVGDTLYWYTSFSGGVGSTVVPIPTTTSAGTQTWYVSQISQFGCWSDRSRIDVHVSLTPNDTIVSSDTGFICQGDTVILSASGNIDSTFQYIWTLPLNAHLISGSGRGPLRVVFNDVDTNYVTLLVLNGNCSSKLDSQIVRTRFRPLITMTTRKEICLTDSLNVQLSSSSANIEKFIWNFDNADTVYAGYPTGPYGIRWNTYGQHIISVQALYQGCYSKLLLDTITVHRLPDARITSSDITQICPGDSILLQAKDVNPNNTYYWSPAQFFDANNVPNVYGKGEFAGFVSLTVTDQYNCTATDSVTITTLQSCCTMYFPSAFTPNNDGVNDVFHSLNPGGHRDVSVFRIQNRWGQTVFQTNNENFGWDGTYNNVAQDIGTYYYYVRFQCNGGPVTEEKGELTLVR